MSSTLEHEPAVTPETPEFPIYDRTPQVLRTPRVAVGLLIVLGLVFTFYARKPLFHTDLWGHLAYGRYIVEHNAIPATEPFMPLAEGMPVVDTAWLSQVLGYRLHQQWGPTALQFAYALAITLCYGLLTLRFYKTSHSVLVTLAGLLLFGLMTSDHFVVTRPEIAGVVCFVTLLTWMTGKLQHSRASWVVIPGLFALWANLHGTFVLGVATLGCFALGRAMDLWRRTGHWQAFGTDRAFRRYFLLAELAAVACLLNPYGLQLWREVLKFSAHPNLEGLLDWQPLQIRSWDGMMAAFAGLGLMFAYRLSPRRVSATEVLLLLGFGLSALWTSRMLIWWTPIATGCFVLHLQAAWKQASPQLDWTTPSPREGKWTVIGLLLLWVFIGYTPFTLKVLHGKETPLRRTLIDHTPIAAVEYLHKKNITGPILNTYEWGDYLLWAGPKNVQVLTMSHAHLIPTEVWQHYNAMIGLKSDWSELLDRYGINAVVLDKLERKALIAKLKDAEQWQLVFEDGVAAIFIRRKPLL